MKYLRTFPFTDTSPFGFILTVRDGGTVARAETISYLEKKGIQTRMVFAGNMIRQPSMEGIAYRQVGGLITTDKVMNDTFWIGVYPGLTEEMINYIIENIRKFVKASPPKQ